MKRPMRSIALRYGIPTTGMGGAKSPPPGPAVGQVWAFPDGSEVMLTWLRVTGGQTAIGWSMDFGLFHIGPYADREVWPPPEAWLVAGPGAPWAP